MTDTTIPATLPVAGYRINTGHGNHLTETLDHARKSFMWAGKPAWRELTYRDTAQEALEALRAEVSRLTAERDAAREDARRLDAMERNQWEVLCCGEPDAMEWYVVTYNTPVLEGLKVGKFGKTPRAAIDAAMNPSTQEPK